MGFMHDSRKSVSVKLACDPEMISDKILTVHGQKTILDRDLAELYGMPTKRLNEQIKKT